MYLAVTLDDDLRAQVARAADHFGLSFHAMLEHIVNDGIRRRAVRDPKYGLRVIRGGGHAKG